MEGAGSILSNPAVIAGGVSGVVAILLVVVVIRMIMTILSKTLSINLVRLDNSLHSFIDGQGKVIGAIGEASRDFSRSVEVLTDKLYNGQKELMANQARQEAKLDVLLDRTSRTFEQVAIHRGVAESNLMGQPPAIITPRPINAEDKPLSES